jgi:hypothetical protein
VGKLEQAQDEAHRVLRDAARRRTTITYGELVRHIHAVPLQPDSDVLAQLLDAISTDEHHRGRGMLSAVVVHATDDYLPGPGFFKLGSKLGHDVSDKVAFHAEELSRVYAAFANGPQGL